MNKNIVLVTSLLVSVFLIPSVTFASWWNPFSWFNYSAKQSKVPTSVVVNTAQITIKSDTPTSTAIIKKQNSDISTTTVIVKNTPPKVKIIKTDKTSSVSFSTSTENKTILTPTVSVENINFQKEQIEQLQKQNSLLQEKLNTVTQNPFQNQVVQAQPIQEKQPEVQVQQKPIYTPSITVSSNSVSSLKVPGTNIAIVSGIIKAGDSEDLTDVRAELTLNTSGGILLNQISNFCVYLNNSQSSNGIKFDDSKNPFYIDNIQDIKAGDSVPIAIRGDISSVGTIDATLEVYAKGSISKKSVSNIYTFNTLTFEKPSITLLINPNFNSSQVITTNSKHQKIGSFVVGSGKAEGLSLSGIKVGLDSSDLTNYKNIDLYFDGKEVSSPMEFALKSNSFSVSDLKIPVGEPKTIDIYIDTISNAGIITPTISVQGYGTLTNLQLSSNLTGPSVNITE